MHVFHVGTDGGLKLSHARTFPIPISDAEIVCFLDLSEHNSLAAVVSSWFPPLVCDEVLISSRHAEIVISILQIPSLR